MPYSITSSAIESKPGGIVSPSAFAVLRCLHRQVSRLVAFEDAPGVNAGLTICFGKTAAVADQTAG